MKINEFRIPVSTTSTVGSIEGGASFTQMAFTPLQTSSDKGRILKRIVHSEVYAPRPVMNLEPVDEVLITTEYAIMDSVPYQSKAIAGLLQQNYLPDPEMLGVLFKESHTQLFAGDNAIVESSDRFPEDSLYSTPTFDTVAETLYFACSVTITNNGGAPVSIPSLQYINADFYLVVEEVEMNELDYLMRFIQWFFNSQYNYLLNTANIQELTYQQSHALWARGGSNRERMGPTSVFGFGESTLQTFNQLSTLRHDANTMATAQNAFGTGTVSDILPFYLGVQPSIRDHFPPIRYNVVTNVKQML